MEKPDRWVIEEIFEMHRDFSFQYIYEEYAQIPKEEEFVEKVNRATELANIKQENPNFESSNVIEASNDHIILEKYQEIKPIDINSAVKRLLALVD